MEPENLRISEVIMPETVELDLQGISDKDHLIEMLFAAGKIRSEEDFARAIYKRESEASTYMEHFIAIPHAKSESVIQAGIAFARIRDGVMYQTPFGGGIAKLIFMLAIPDQMSADAYINVLALLARLLVHEEFRNALYEVEDFNGLIKAIHEGEALLIED